MVEDLNPQNPSSVDADKRASQLDKKLADKGFTREDIHVFLDERGNRLPNAERYAGKEIQAEDIKISLKQHAVLADTLKNLATDLLAGKDVAPDKLAKKLDAIAFILEKAPEGIKFSQQGRPDFTPFAERQVFVEFGLTGDRKIDARTANELVGISDAKWKELSVTHVWHHVEDGKTMQLVPREVHDVISHAAGAYALKHDAPLVSASEQIMREAYQKQAGYQQDRLAVAVAPSPAVAAAPLMAKPEISPAPQSPATYAAHIQDGNLKTQFSAGDGRGPLGHADFRKEEIGRMLNDPDVKTINGHESWRYKYNYDKAEYEALQRGATPEQAKLAASDRTRQVMARVELAQERAELRVHPYTKDVNTHFNKIGQLRDARVRDLTAQAKREGHEYRGPAPKPPTERQFEARTAAHIFGAYACLDIYAQRYGYSPKVYAEKKTGLDLSIADYRQRTCVEHERSLSGLSREPSMDRSFGPEIGF